MYKNPQFGDFLFGTNKGRSLVDNLFFCIIISVENYKQ